MKVCNSLEEDQGFPGKRTQDLISSPDRVFHHESQTPAALSRSSSPTSGQTCQVKSKLHVFYSCPQSSPETNQREQGFSNQKEDNTIERKHSRVPCWTNTSHIPSFRTSSGSSIRSLHQEDRSSGKLTMRDQVQTDDQASRQSSDILDTSAEAAPVKNRRHVCCWKACGQKFVSQKDLSAHVNKDHARFECPDVDFQCHWEGCPREGKGFNARYKMLIHIRTHTNEKPHMCVVCGKSFSRLENLKIHTRSHTGERPYSCTFPGCNKAYSNSSDRFKHIRTHQEQKPYKCKMPGCRKQYTDPSSLRKHVRTHRHTPDSSGLELNHLLSTITQSDLKMEACSPSQESVYDQEDLSSRQVCELKHYINTVRQQLEKQDLTNVNFQTIHTIQNVSADSRFPDSETYTEDLTKAICNHVFSNDGKNYTDRYRDVLGTRRFNWQHQSMNSHVDSQESGSSNNKSKQNLSYIKHEPQSSRQSPVSTHFETIDEQPWKKEHKIEENKKDLIGAIDDLHKRNRKSQSGFSNTDCMSLLSTHDLSNIPSLLVYNHGNNDCSQEVKMTSCSSSPVLEQGCSTKSPKLEHWKKRKLLISEKELQASLQVSQSPTSNRPQKSPTVHVSLNPTSLRETTLQSPVPSNCSHLSTTTSVAPLFNRHSPLAHSHLSSISHCPVSLTPICPQRTPTLTPELSSSIPLSSSSSSSSCQTAVPSLYLLHPPLHPLLSNSYSSMPTMTHTISPSQYYTHNSSSLSESPLLPIANTCPYNSTVDPYLGLNRTYILPPGPAFNHTDFHPPGVKLTWEHPGFSSLPALVNLENDSLLSAASFHHFANSLRLMYQDLPLDLHSLYHSHAFRFPLYLGVNR